MQLLTARAEQALEGVEPGDDGVGFNPCYRRLPDTGEMRKLALRKAGPAPSLPQGASCPHALDDTRNKIK